MSFFFFQNNMEKICLYFFIMRRSLKSTLLRVRLSLKSSVRFKPTIFEVSHLPREIPFGSVQREDWRRNSTTTKKRTRRNGAPPAFFREGRGLKKEPSSDKQVGFRFGPVRLDLARAFCGCFFFFRQNNVVLQRFFPQIPLRFVFSLISNAEISQLHFESVTLLPPAPSACPVCSTCSYQCSLSVCLQLLRTRH